MSWTDYSFGRWQGDVVTGLTTWQTGSLYARALLFSCPGPSRHRANIILYYSSSARLFSGVQVAQRSVRSQERSSTLHGPEEWAGLLTMILSVLCSCRDGDNAQVLLGDRQVCRSSGVAVSHLWGKISSQPASNARALPLSLRPIMAPCATWLSLAIRIQELCVERLN
jgi:hypothetical protein